MHLTHRLIAGWRLFLNTSFASAVSPSPPQFYQDTVQAIANMLYVSPLNPGNLPSGPIYIRAISPAISFNGIPGGFLQIDFDADVSPLFISNPATNIINPLLFFDQPLCYKSTSIFTFFSSQPQCLALGFETTSLWYLSKYTPRCLLHPVYVPSTTIGYSLLQNPCIVGDRNLGPIQAPPPTPPPSSPPPSFPPPPSSC